MLRQAFDDIPFEGCPTLRGVVMYAAGSRFVDGGTTVLTPNELADAVELLLRMSEDEELAGNISKVGMGDLDWRRPDLGEAIQEGIAQALADHGIDLGVRVFTLGDRGVDPEGPEEARNHASTLIDVISAIMAYRSDIPSDYVEQRAICLGSRMESDEDRRSLQLFEAMLDSPFYYSTLPQEVKDEVDFDGVARALRARRVTRTAYLHRKARITAMLRRNPHVIDIEVPYEEDHD